ncbi:hypothetical protein KP79_PYT23680 [Mizuhopecten yessoensis]|uniref:Uncharacterized protein n=1 Tax=Mizuhopecten yessoensis TaxID=6573 RepID=A0A210PQW6_MIZYE|nr:hypothetical protein KP79_PYT23680 [Mizuhopecten yessoensis]
MPLFGRIPMQEFQRNLVVTRAAHSPWIPRIEDSRVICLNKQEEVCWIFNICWNRRNRKIFKVRTLSGIWWSTEISSKLRPGSVFTTAGMTSGICFSAVM